jgi:hypothetical protein
MQVLAETFGTFTTPGRRQCLTCIAIKTTAQQGNTNIHTLIPVDKLNSPFRASFRAAVFFNTTSAIT